MPEELYIRDGTNVEKKRESSLVKPYHGGKRMSMRDENKSRSRALFSVNYILRVQRRWYDGDVVKRKGKCWRKYTQSCDMWG